jgi:hypothetical protein
MATFTVRVVPLISVSLSRPPTKTLYKQGESLDLEGMVVMGNWEEIGSDRVALSTEGISGYNPEQGGTQNIRFLFEDQTLTFPVTVVPLTSITITKLPTKVSYRQGEAIDLTGLIVTGTWEGIDSQRIQVSARNLSAYDPNRIGQQVVMITVYNTTATFTVTVKGLMAIKILSPPAKIYYDYGESLDITGMVVVGVFSDLSEEPITVNASNTRGFDNTRAGDQTVLVTIDEKIAAFSVQVRVLSSIAIQRTPLKAVYEPGEALDLNGMVVVGIYTDKSTKIVPTEKLTISGFNSGLPGQQTVIVTAEGKQASFSVTVLPKRSTN